MPNNPNIEVDMAVAFAKILMSNDISDKIKELRLSALKELYDYLKYYEKSGYVDKLICKIAEKKIDMIMQIKTKAEKDRVIKPKCPTYDGNKFIPDKYSVPEEELICWSEASLEAPLSEAGFKRYMELFKEIFPDKEIEIFKDGYEERDIADDFEDPDI